MEKISKYLQFFGVKMDFLYERQDSLLTDDLADLEPSRFYEVDDDVFNESYTSDRFNYCSGTDLEGFVPKRKFSFGLHVELNAFTERDVVLWTGEVSSVCALFIHHYCS